jgi:hypothetical protein
MRTGAQAKGLLVCRTTFLGSVLLVLATTPEAGSWEPEDHATDDGIVDRLQRTFTEPGSGLVWHRKYTRVHEDTFTPDESRTNDKETQSHSPHAARKESTRRIGISSQKAPCEGTCQYIVRINTGGEDNRETYARLVAATSGRFIKYIQVCIAWACFCTRVCVIYLP